MEKRVKFSDVVEEMSLSDEPIDTCDSSLNSHSISQLKNDNKCAGSSEIYDAGFVKDEDLKEFASEISDILSSSAGDTCNPIHQIGATNPSELTFRREIIDGAMSDDSEDEEAKFNINLLNVFIKYYTMTYPEKRISNMFEGIDITNVTQTNHITELFYGAMKEYDDNYNQHKKDEGSKSEYQKCKVYKPSKFNITNVDECYGLSVNGKLEYVSELLFPLIICVADKFMLDNWIIINLK
jgi:hypothetical protein